MNSNKPDIRIIRILISALVIINSDYENFG